VQRVSRSPRDPAVATGCILCPLTDSVSGFGEDLFDFVVHWETANVPFRENYIAVNHNIELAGLARLYLDFLTEAGVQ